MINRITSWADKSQVGEGWHPLVEKLEADLLVICSTFDVAQVKEKFGGLRYYASVPEGTPEGVYKTFQARIDMAEADSYALCEVCGGSGVLSNVTRYWMKTLCPQHLSEAQAQRQELFADAETGDAPSDE